MMVFRGARNIPLRSLPPRVVVAGRVRVQSYATVPPPSPPPPPPSSHKGDNPPVGGVSPTQNHMILYLAGGAAMVGVGYLMVAGDSGPKEKVQHQAEQISQLAGRAKGEYGEVKGSGSKAMEGVKEQVEKRSAKGN